MGKTIDFLQLTAKLPYPTTVKGKLSTIHATVIDQFVEEFTNRHTEKLRVVHAINCISYMYTSSDSLPIGWNPDDPLHTFYNYDDDFLKDHLVSGLYISARDIDWTNVPISEKSTENVPIGFSEQTSVVATPKQMEEVSAIPIQDKQIVTSTTPQKSYTSVPKKSPIFNVLIPTDKSDLYIQPPVVPRFDTAHPVMSGRINETLYAIYPSFPLVPTKQNEISATTDVKMMSENDLRRLYPNCLIRTRATCMYEPCEGMELDPILGLIIPIEGYSKQQLRDNLVKYPHIFRLLKQVDGLLDSFYSTIEINGQLYKISEIWNDLPESSVIPYTKEFVKEYVVRRYLLERDLKEIDHVYKLYGTLDPYLTLFTSVKDYLDMGYTDIIGMARSCVTARVSYKQSRNPIIRGLQNHA